MRTSVAILGTVILASLPGGCTRSARPHADPGKHESVMADRKVPVNPGLRCDTPVIADLDKSIREHDRRAGVMWHVVGPCKAHLIVSDFVLKPEQGSCADGTPADGDFVVSGPPGMALVTARLTRAVQNKYGKGTRRSYCYALKFIHGETVRDVDPEIEIIWR